MRTFGIKEKVLLTFRVNGIERTVKIFPHTTLLQVLRDNLALTGTKHGCGIGECGACTVLMEGEPVNACLVLAAKTQGKEILTVEGLGSRDELHSLQKAFIAHGAVQCGFCTPGILMAAKALLDKTPKPSEEQIKETLAGNLCRCTGYQQIIEAIKAVGKE